MVVLIRFMNIWCDDVHAIDAAAPAALLGCGASQGSVCACVCMTLRQLKSYIVFDIPGGMLWGMWEESYAAVRKHLKQGPW